MHKIDNFYSPDSVIVADREANKVLKIPSLILMENAGRECSRHILSITERDQNVLVLCGPGSNGGDGFVIARHLLRESRKVEVLLSCPLGNLKGASSVNARIAVSLGISVHEIGSLSDNVIRELIYNANIVVDSLLGTGASGPLRGQILRVVDLLSSCDSFVVAIDSPTGVDMSTGSVENISVRADFTITMIAPKIGHAVEPGLSATGQLVVADIGLHSSSILKDSPVISTTDSSFFASLSDSIHKGDRGGVLIVAGSISYPGAAVLAARASLRGGAGFVVLMSHRSVLSYLSNLPEVIPEEIPEDVEDFSAKLKKWSNKCSVLVLGPGLDRDENASFIYKAVLSLWKGPLIIDGDGLFFLAEGKRFEQEIIITPHEGEAAKLLGRTSEWTKNNRFSTIKDLAKEFNVSVLKGHGTLIGFNEQLRVSFAGSNVLAVPGSGDVLSGLIGAFKARGLSSFDAASLAVEVHGTSGEILASKMGRDGVIASDIADAIPTALRKVVHHEG